MSPEDLWPLLIANFPLVAALLIAFQKGWIVIGSAFTREMQNKDQEILFREKLRQEVLADTNMLKERDREKTEALRELTEVVKQTLDLNDRLLNDTFNQRWDGNDRRSNPRK